MTTGHSHRRSGDREQGPRASSGAAPTPLSTKVAIRKAPVSFSVAAAACADWSRGRALIAAKNRTMRRKADLAVISEA